MRRLGVICIIVLLLTSLVTAIPASEASIETFVNDYADIFTSQEEAAISNLADELLQSNRAQVAVVTIDSLDGRDIEGYSLELAQGHLGTEEQNNGLLLLIAVEDRAYRFEVGRGLEGILNDGRVGRLGRTYLVPAFQVGEYGQGTLAAVQATRDLLVDEIEIPEPAQDNSDTPNIELIIAVIILVIILNILQAYAQKRVKRPGAGWWWVLLASMRSGRGRGGFGGSSRSGGFGGGSFGGGGASGGW